MPRFALALSVLALTIAAPLAQEAPPAPAPAAAPAPAPAAAPTITVDPHAIVDAMPKQGQLLTGLYATLATIELCNITVPEPGATAMNAHRRQLENDFHLEGESAQKAYDTVKADVEKTGVDCAEGSVDRKQTDAVIKVYSGT
ncbi:hypothetical protein [Devosia sp.]|uniref:hypothetical protein n=1 Tax=Devosia sp. TaxID=1871048 RepID=UPI001AD2300B|nr:hypothetical protein [Devosia sp.]MBN9334562.1 hypothetical protein [Devosia sp.]